jgi:hypothetical protein
MSLQSKLDLAQTTQEDSEKDKDTSTSPIIDSGDDGDEYVAEEEPGSETETESPLDTLVFTRYLYIESDVCQALISSILQKDKERAMFWAAELLHSGLANTLVRCLWNIYMTYYFSLNMEFFNYLLKNTKRIYAACENMMKWDADIQVDMDAMASGDSVQLPCDGDINPELSIDDDAELALRDILFNLAIRPFNADVLTVCLSRPEGYYHSFPEANVFAFNDSDSVEQRADQVAALLCAKMPAGIHDMCFTEWMDSKENIQHTFDALERVGMGVAATNQKKILAMSNHFKKMEGVVVRDGTPVDPVVSRIALSISISSYVHKLKMGKKLFVAEDPEVSAMILKANRTKLRTDIPPTSPGTKFERHEARHILKHATKFSIADEIAFTNQGAQSLVREDPYVTAYWYHWVYYAARCPLWRKRLFVFGGHVDHAKKSTEFDCDDNLEAFHEEYNLDPDEQPYEVMERNLAHKRRRSTTNEFCAAVSQLPACSDKLFPLCEL